MHKYIGIEHDGIEYEIPIVEIAGILHRQIKEAEPEVEDAEIIKCVIGRLETAPDIIAFMRTLPWDEISRSARVVRWTDAPPDLATATFIAPYDEQRSVSLPQDGAGGRAPMDLYLSLMWQEDVPLFASVFTVNGKPNAAAIVIRGDEEQINAHLQVAAQLSSQIHDRPEGAPAPPPRQKYNH